MPMLKENPTLVDLQSYVSAMEQERGFAGQDVLQKCLLLGEEVGELFKAIRKRQQMSIDPLSKVSQVEDELADLLVMMCAVANRMGVDLEQAFRAKEEVNKRRSWAT